MQIFSTSNCWNSFRKKNTISLVLHAVNELWQLNLTLLLSNLQYLARLALLCFQVSLSSKTNVINVIAKTISRNLGGWISVILVMLTPWFYTFFLCAELYSAKLRGDLCDHHFRKDACCSGVTTGSQITLPICPNYENCANTHYLALWS